MTAPRPVTFSDAVVLQLGNFTAEVEVHALVVRSVGTELGETVPGTTACPQLRQCTEEVERITHHKGPLSKLTGPHELLTPCFVSRRLRILLQEPIDRGRAAWVRARCAVP
ncbi:MAG: hypothetical protein QOH40_3037 [Arthrobacter pascens]|jgi:hypothetical protein|nr:hypothetical protein [Arthrobacter pascens]